MINGKELNIIRPEEKQAIDRRADFIRELEITKHRLEIKPRKVNMMQAQELMLRDIMDVTPRKKIYIPGNEGFV
jgi:hypothetical protein